MSVKLEKIHSVEIPAADLKDGQIAVITSWSNNFQVVWKTYIGCVVQRYKQSLVVIGENSRKGWANFFDCSSVGCYVQILENGTALIIENNK